MDLLYLPACVVYIYVQVPVSFKWDQKCSNDMGCKHIESMQDMTPSSKEFPPLAPPPSNTEYVPIGPQAQIPLLESHPQDSLELMMAGQRLMYRHIARVQKIETAELEAVDAAQRVVYAPFVKDFKKLEESFWSRVKEGKARCGNRPRVDVDNSENEDADDDSDHDNE
jgi:hypothetical protein